MKLLIAHGDATSRYALREVANDLSALGLEPVESDEGGASVEILLGADAPGLALVDWDLPGCNGPELCRQVRAQRRSSPPYIIVLAQTDEQIGEAFAAGADDCLNAAAGGHELQARSSPPAGSPRCSRTAPLRRLDRGRSPRRSSARLAEATAPARCAGAQAEKGPPA